MLAGLGERKSALLTRLLHNKDGLTVDQLARDLAISRTAINQHLANLERDNFIRADEMTSTGGRPGRKYVLTDQGLHLFPKQYNLFSSALLEAMVKTVGRDKMVEHLAEIGVQMAQPFKRQLTGKPLDEKLKAVTAGLNEMGFDTHVAPSDSGPANEIVAYNCVYHQLAKANLDVCELDLSFLAEATEAKVDHESCMAKGDGACRFSFR